jgi:hypothetical protein
LPIIFSSSSLHSGDKLVPGAIGFDQLKAYVDSALAKAPAGTMPLGDTSLVKSVPTPMSR